MIYQSPYLRSIPEGGTTANTSLSLQPNWANAIDLDYRVNGPGEGLSLAPAPAPAPATIQGQPKQAEKPPAPPAAEEKKAGAPNKIEFAKQAPSYSNSPGSSGKSNSSSRSYDYSGFDDHIKRQDALAGARDAKKSALYDGDVKTSMLAGNKVRELVNHLRRDAPGTTENDPYQFKTPLSRVSSQSDTTSTNRNAGSTSYTGPKTEMSIPASGGGGAANGGQQVPAGTLPSLPSPPMNQPDVYYGVDDTSEQKPVLDQSEPRGLPLNQLRRTTPESRFEQRMRRGMIA